MRVLFQNLLLVDEGVRIGEGRQEGARRKFETDHDGRGIGRLDLVHHVEIAGARAQHALWREGDHLEALRDILGGQRVAIVELDALPDLERVGLVVIGRFRHFGAEIAHEIGRRGRVVRIDPDKDAVIGRDRMDRGVGRLAMPVEGRRRIGRDQVGQRAAAFRGIRRARRRRCGEHPTKHHRAKPPSAGHHFLRNRLRAKPSLSRPPTLAVPKDYLCGGASKRLAALDPSYEQTAPAICRARPWRGPG